ncbi:centrosomal protein of 152 kDa isoform X2 [Pogona vitticeps]
MSLDFDSAALQMHQEDEEYDQEDYAREQELQQLLTGLPHDMLEDSGDHLSDYSTPEDHEQAHEPWDQEAPRWDGHPLAANPQSDYEQGQDMYVERYLYDQGNLQGEMHASDWPDHPNEGEDRSMFEISGGANEEDSSDVYLGGTGCKVPGRYQQTNVYHLPEDFRPYTNGHQEEFSNQHGKRMNTAETKKEHLKLQFGASETTDNQPVEAYKVIYKPYQNNIQQPVTLSPDAGRRNEAFEEMQQEFLATGESSSENMQILQLQVLNKAKGRKLEELNLQLEEKAQQIRYLSHQLAILKDEKDGMCLSLQESQKLYQNGKEKELQLESQIKVLETQIQTLTANEEQLIKQSKVAEVAMESLQQQLLELRRSDALQRAREQHEAVVAALKQRYEEQASSLQQKLDATHMALQEQSELCCRLTEHVKQLERTLEESRVEKNEMIGRLSRSLEESQNQCASLLQTGLVNEINQLRMQLQQAQSAQLLSSEMNKALQEELKELKEEIALYESAETHGVFLNDPGGELNVEMTDSYVDLGIKKVNKKTGLHSSVTNKEQDRGLSRDEIILDLKNEMKRLLSSNKAKRNRVSQLQSDLEDCRQTIEELKQQLVKMSAKELKGKNVEVPSDAVQSGTSEEILRLKKENETLQQDVKSHKVRIQELTESQEQLKHANQELCSQMRQMVQDSDRDKQEALDRCERTYHQHYEEVKKKLCGELAERHAKEREKIIRAYEENITQLKADLDELNKEMLTVKECYISVCRERDEQEAGLKAAWEQEQRLKEEEFQKQFLKEKEEALKTLRTELEEEFQNSMVLAKSQWQAEKEADLKQHTENEVAKVNAFWEKELKETKDRAVQEVEKEWQSRLDQALDAAKRAVVELKDSGSQTEPLSLRDDFLRPLIAEAVEEQTQPFQEALAEKEKAVRELEAKHHESIASQVESSLTKARARWLQELTELEEFKAHLKAAKAKWEAEESRTGTAKQVSLALSAAEEKLKKEIENSEKIRARTKELEEKTFSLERELELKKEEIPAIVKAELAKARTQWNKEKQEEMLRIQEQNEKDYHLFLHEHRNKINEVLTKAKEEFAKQKEDLLEQKEAELKMCLSRRQQEWALQEAKRFHAEIGQYEDRILAQVALTLDDVHRELVRFASDELTWPTEWNTPSPVQTSLPFKEKLTFCLQKAYKSTVYALLEKAKQKWKEHEDRVSPSKTCEDSHMRSGEGETGDTARPLLYDVGQQVELERRLRKPQPSQEAPMGSVPSVASNGLCWPSADSKCKTRDLLFQEGACCQHCHQQLEKKEKECQDLKRKLDKACRHLQSAVKEQKAKSEQIQESGKIEESLTEENPSINNKLEDFKSASIPPRSSSEGCISKPCASCDAKALEEMRSQYIKAVGKIKSDMLRYIHESKERAAEIIKAEVSRERQETTRKMRKYYLICLQQLLMDDGKPEGAEKKIISAASKIATMAKILETPVRNASHPKASQSAQSQNTKLFAEVEEPQRHHPRQIPAESHARGENPAAHRRIPWSLQQQLDAENPPAVASRTQTDGRALKPPGGSSAPSLPVTVFTADGSASCGLPPLSAPQNPPPCLSQAKLQDLLPSSCTGGGADSGAACSGFQHPSEKTGLREPDGVQAVKHRTATFEKSQGQETVETPVRDSGASLDWTLLRDAPLHPFQKVHSGAQAGPCEQFYTASHFLPAKDDASVFCWRPGGPQDTSPVTRRQDPPCQESHSAVNPSRVPCSNPDNLSPSDAPRSGAMFCSTAGKSCHPLHSRKQMRDVAAFHQDSGFDSPQINFD